MRIYCGNEMNGVFGHDSALFGYTMLGTTCANKRSFVMNHAPGAGSPLDLLTSSPTCYHCTMGAKQYIL